MGCRMEDAFQEEPLMECNSFLAWDGIRTIYKKLSDPHRRESGGHSGLSPNQ